MQDTDTILDNITSAPVYSIQATEKNKLTEDDKEKILYMYRKILDKRSINLKRLGYYKSETIFKDLAISTPETLKNKLHYSLGLGKIVVDKITNPVSFVEITTDNQDLNKKLGELTRENGYKEIVHKLFESLGIFGCSFLSVTKGDTKAGEPEILLIPLTPLTASGILNQRTGALEYGLSITKFDEVKVNKPVKQMIYYRKNDYVVIDVVDDGLVYECVDNPFPDCSLHLIANTPSIFQPFGKSLLTNSIMEAIDSCVATIIRATISAEISTLPQRYIAGSLDNDEESPYIKKLQGLKNRLGDLWVFDLPEGEKLQIGQLEGSDFQAQLRQLSFYAHLISNETSIPAGELGFLDTTLANPQSAESILAGRQALIERINSIIDGITPQLNNVIKNIANYYNIQTNLVEHRFSVEYKQTFLLQGAEVVRKLAQAMPNIVHTDYMAQILGMTQREWQETRNQMNNTNLQQGINTILDKLGSNTQEKTSNNENKEV